MASLVHSSQSDRKWAPSFLLPESSRFSIRSCRLEMADSCFFFFVDHLVRSVRGYLPLVLFLRLVENLFFGPPIFFMFFIGFRPMSVLFLSFANFSCFIFLLNMETFSLTAATPHYLFAFSSFPPSRSAALSRKFSPFFMNFTVHVP